MRQRRASIFPPRSSEYANELKKQADMPPQLYFKTAQAAISRCRNALLFAEDTPDHRQSVLM
jgi:predicted Rossmann fold nucleotide-binding protein DprA/Smf involved in DNA uptake